MNYFKNWYRINRSPDAEGGGGDTPAAETPAAETPAAAAAPQPQYVDRAAFDTFAQEMRTNFQRMPQPQAQAQQEQAEPTRPDAKKYNFDRDEDIEKYQRDMYRWNKHQDAKDDEKTNSEKSQRETAITQYRGHQTRVAEYKKEHPDFETDLKSAVGKLNVLAPVERAVYASKNSALVLHYLAKNPGDVDDLNLLAETDGLEAVRERLGEMAAYMKTSQKEATGNERAAGARPLRTNLRGNATTSQRQPTMEERYKRFRG
jgi:hypothetical protein